MRWEMATHQDNMQLFFELRQKFPGVSQEILQRCIMENSGDRDRCLIAMESSPLLQLGQRNESRYFPQRHPSYPSPNYHQQQYKSPPLYQKTHGRVSDPGVSFNSPQQQHSLKPVAQSAPPLPNSQNPFEMNYGIPYYKYSPMVGGGGGAGAPSAHSRTTPNKINNGLFPPGLGSPKMTSPRVSPKHQSRIPEALNESYSLQPPQLTSAGYQLFQPQQDPHSSSSLLTGHINQLFSPKHPISEQFNQNEKEEGAYIQALLIHQRARLDLLHKEFNRGKENLERLKGQVGAKEREIYKTLQRNTSVEADETQKLHKDITKLRVECHCLSMEVDVLTKKDPVPLGVTEEDFYGNIFTGQASKSFVAKPEETPSATEQGNASNECGALGGGGGGASHEEEEEDEGRKWKCQKCTFENHPALNKCEMCEEERFISPFTSD